MSNSMDIDDLEIIDYNVINNELVLYVDEDISDLEFDIDDDGYIIEDMETLEQEGGGEEDDNDDDGFTIQTVNERYIRKFNVHGFEYMVAMHDMSNLNYLEAVQTLHHRFDRKYRCIENIIVVRTDYIIVQHIYSIYVSCRTIATLAG